MHAYDSIESATCTLQNVLAHKRLDEGTLAKLASDRVLMSLGVMIGWIELGMERNCLDIAKDVATQLSSQRTIKDFEVKVLVGQEDQAETPAKVEEETVAVLIELGFTVTFSVIPETGHPLPIEAPGPVALAISEMI
jgi:hypothetical protein